jgi:hypothetical protein
MQSERYTRQIKAVTGNGTGSIKITPSPGMRLHELLVRMVTVAGVNTLAALVGTITEIRWKVGTTVRAKLSGLILRDWLLLHGTTFDWTGLPNTASEITLPFAPSWFLDNVADSLAWNPALLGGDITVEIDCTQNLTCTVFETVDDNLSAPSSGIITYEVIKPVAGGLSFYVQKEIDLKGRLLAASIYPDSTNGNAITPAALLLGPSDLFAHENLSAADNLEQNERFGLTPAAAGRTANIYDIVPVKADMLARGWDLAAWGDCKINVQAAGAMAGTCSILLARLEAK